ncbi:MAG: hypothetical protein K2N10_01495, partial [Muribaculaceae bacterium]|nr:hypothetical protein [Muribaculaceae bacterium]
VPALYAGTEDFESVEETEFGKYTDGKITAPARTSFNNEPYALSNYISEFTLTIEKTAPVETWKSIGEGEWFEGLLHASNPWGFPEGLSWKIDVEESETTPGLYRIKPYASDNYLSENFRDEEDGLYDEETVLYINATDPNKVYTTAESNFFPYEMCKFIGNNPENGQSGNVYGTLTDGVISFPEGAFYLDDEYAGKVLLESGSSFQIVLPGSTEPEPEWKSIGKGNWVDGFFTDQSYVMLKENINNVWEVEIEESTATPGIYRVLPYADGTIGSDAGHMREADNENYFVVNATNPDSVYVMGNFTPFNKFKFYQKCPEAAEDFDAEHDEPQYGKLANGEIFFPIGSFTKIYEDGDYTANTDGILMLVLPGTELKDYQLVASTNLCHDSDQAAINFSIVGSGIASARTTTVAGHYIFPEDVEGEPVAVDLTAETIDHKVSNPVGGNTTIVEALDANGNVRRKLTVYHFNNNDVTGWHAVEGKIAKVTEATLFPAIDDVASQEITCTIEEKDGTPGMYRLVNTYADHSLALDHKERHNHYLYIDATDPDYVILVPSATGIGSVKYGDFYLTNEACIYDQIGFKEFAKENGMCGTMENDVIDLGNVKYAANNRWRGAWISAGDDEVYNITVELVDDSGISEISSDSETDAVYYNIRGQRIASPTVPGFYIRNNTKVYIK